MPITLSCTKENWSLTKPFVITGYEYTSLDVVVVEVTDGVHTGRGEAAGVDYLDDLPDSMVDLIASHRSSIESAPCRETLLHLFPPGGARNAVDCALWDLECKKAGASIWTLCDMTPRIVETVFAIGIDTPENMAAAACALSGYRRLKVKLDDDGPVERLEAIRRARPDVDLIIDINQGWSFLQLQDFMPDLVHLGISMIEQPLPIGEDSPLSDFQSPIEICADESCQSLGDLDLVKDRYQMINIKLDKTGGLTEALELAHAARKAGLGLMVGNMIGTSLAMAPAFVIAQLCDYADLDGPLLLKSDRMHPITYQDGVVALPSPALWG